MAGKSRGSNRREPPTITGSKAIKVLGDHAARGDALLAKRPAEPLTEEVHSQWETTANQ